MTQSPRFSFNSFDYKIMLTRAKEYLIPLALIYIPFVTAKILENGFQLSDFSIDQIQQGALILYILNRIFLAGQLFVEGKK